MSPRAADLFRQAIDLPPEERRAFLARECPDPAERAEVELLFAHDRESDSIVAGPIRSEAAAIAREIEGAKSLPALGAYRAVKLIGHGGMGTVYLAERCDGTVDQQVAVKLLPMALAGGPALERSLEERRILAKLEHPGIARFQDAGATADGVPFLVMEYVRGIALNAHCEERRLDLESRVRLFRKVCDAVDYAHRNLILHRDLKPENILVTDSGEPKLLDFGIAKVVDPGNAASRTVLAAMTPDYASPEQVRGEATGVSTDIYSLGAVLYRILTGQKPHRIEGSAPAAIERAICDDPVVAPSMHRRELRGDLENILLKALRKEQERRYRTVAELSADLDNWLRALPVGATPDSFAYRAGRFLRRNRMSAALGSVAAAAVLGFGSYAIVQGRRAERRFEEVRKLANVFLFDFEKSVRNVPGAIQARELVVKTGLEYLDRLALEAGRDKKLSLELASAYFQMADTMKSTANASGGNIPAAIHSLERGIELYRKAGIDSLAPAERTGYYKAFASLALYLNLQGQSARARTSVEGALAEAERWLAQEPSSEMAISSAAGLAFNLAGLHSRSGDLAAGIAAGRKSVLLAERLAALPGDAEQRRKTLAATLYNLGNLLYQAGQGQEAAEVCGRAVKILEPLVERAGVTHADRRALMIAYAYWAQALESLVRNDPAALGKMNEALGKGTLLAERGATEDPGNVLALTDLANALQRAARGKRLEGKHPEAIALLERSSGLALRWRQMEKSNKPAVLLIENLTLVTRIRVEAGMPAEALATGRQAVELAAKWHEQTPSQRDARTHLAEARLRYAAALSAAGDRLGADKEYELAESVLSASAEGPKTDAAVRELLQEVQRLRSGSPRAPRR